MKIKTVSLFTKFVAACSAVVLLASCSGFFPGKTTVVSMTISPTGAFVKPLGTQQYSATATFGDNSQGDVTDQVTWTSSQTGVATIDASSGLATAVALGTSNITAKSSNNVTASSVLTVSNKTVTGLTISPTSVTLSLSGTLGFSNTAQFSATATYSDGTNGAVTPQWTSSNTSVVTINSNGLATAQGVNSATITASFGGQTATASVTVEQ